MRFLCVNQSTKANIFGEEYQLKPLDPNIENLEDILVTDTFSANELLTRHPDILVPVNVDMERCDRFPQVVNSLCDITSKGKILILRNGGIGDHIMLLPALKVFREMFPKGSEIWLATQKEKHPLFYSNSTIDRLISLPVRLSTLLEADYLIDFSGRQDWYDYSSRHMTDSYLNFLDIDYASITDKAPKIAWNCRYSPDTFNLVIEAKEANSRKPLILLNWKASNRLRDLPPDKILFLSDRSEDVCFVVAQPSSSIGEVSEILARYPDNILDCTVQMQSLGDYMTVIAHCDGVISTDTGTVHIAESLGKPCVILYGPTKDDLWIRYYKKTIPIRSEYLGINCQSPCGLTKDTENGCPEAIHFGSKFSPCLLSITENRIVTAFQTLLEKVN